MRLFRFDKEVGKSIAAYGSQQFMMSKLLMSKEGMKIHHIGCMHIGPDGLVGEHPATIDQLFIVVSGEGWVTANHGPRRIIKTGQAAFWTSGEVHESGSSEGMTVIVVEGNGLEPEMPEAED
ncbi:hypothetical protein JCM10914A_21180 [Paenibacillus sp. JCM 10914]|uniref:cupin domain-containing protein n=1 Tax=Paenibacillus sp. JCM 10914 TaxID=1236974 RepID=UPI0003CC43FC|nr:cupin domain-containing protein [Paenibacillus sp. JCM 10914]GAE08656.1 hypothetical protein JCM10914_4972 [Paenibacillus sp. JCM 10914]